MKEIESDYFQSFTEEQLNVNQLNSIKGGDGEDPPGGTSGGGTTFPPPADD